MTSAGWICCGLRAQTDSRIEPIAVGERQWREDQGSLVLEMARREGQEIPLPLRL
jgi:hypothetical protein